MDDNEISALESLNLDKAHLGKAGEYLTAGKLLLNGFNVFNGAIDDGIDIVASKNDHFYKIQVKTCQDIEGYDSGKFVAGINLSSLSKHNSVTTYVVFVMHYLGERTSIDSAGNHNRYEQDFIVLPAKEIFKITDATSGHVSVQIKSTLVVGEATPYDWMYKLTHKKQELILDQYLIDSFLQIVEPNQTPQI